MKWKALVIDDEQLARQRLIRLLKPYEDITIIGEAANGQEGLILIGEKKPDLVFLDIEMPLLNGFQMLSLLKDPPVVIFTTAYDQYAIKAFDEGSVDYLLKPIQEERLEKTIAKLQKLSGNTQSIPLEALLKQLQPKVVLKNLTVKTGDKIILIRFSDIIYIEAEDKYVFIYTTGNQKHLTDYTISSLDQKLPDQFLQVSRGTIINCDHIKEIRKGFNGSKVFVMDANPVIKLTSARSFSEVINERLGLK